MNDTQRDTSTFRPAFWLALLGLLALTVYSRGLPGGFVFDDTQNIVENANLQAVDGTILGWVTASLSSSSGMLMRPISMFSFAANFYLSGLDPLSFKVTNVLIHLICGLLLYALCVRLIPLLVSDHCHSVNASATRKISLVVAAAWLLHPLHVSSVLYVVQRMNLLAALFTLLGLLCYTVGRTRMLSGEKGLLTACAGLLTFSVLATFSKENGVLSCAYALVIEVFCFRFAAPTSQQRIILRSFFVAILALPVAILFAYLIVHPDWLLGRYAIRDFSLYERLMTQPRILAHYVLWLFMPLPSWMGLYHDDIVISTGPLVPPTTSFAIAGWLLAVIAAWHLRTRFVALGFGVAWFLAGHSMESTVLPLEMVFEHRNYLPSAGLIAGALILLWRLTENVPRYAVTLGAVTALLILAIATGVRAHSWGDSHRLALDMAKHHPASPRSLYEAGRAIYSAGIQEGNAEAARDEATALFLRAMQLDRNYIHPAISNILINGTRTVAPEADIEDLARRLRAAPMFQATPVLLLLHRIADGRVLVSPEGTRLIFEAAMDNPSTISAMKASLLSAYGRYFFLILKDAQSAVSLTIAATEQDPMNPILHINLAKLAIQLEEPAIAEAAALKARDVDFSQIHREEISLALKQASTLSARRKAAEALPKQLSEQ